VPDVSILVQPSGSIALLGLVLEKLFSARVRAWFEIVLVTDDAHLAAVQACTDALRSEERATITRIHVSGTLSPVRAVNTAARAARGRFLLVLGPGVLVGDAWLDRMLAVFERFPQTGLVSPVTNEDGGGWATDPDAYGTLYAEYDALAARFAARSEPDFVPEGLRAFALMIARSLFNRLGGLDERFAGLPFAAEHLSVRAAVQGAKLAIARDVYVYTHPIVPDASAQPMAEGSPEVAKSDPETVAESDLETAASAPAITDEMRLFNMLADMAGVVTPFGVRERSGAAVPLISVVVRTKDRPEMLAVALTSLASQTFRDFEVVVVNDGGKPVEAVLARFESRLRITSVNHAESHGRGPAGNAGIAAARGAWLCFLDDDDIVYPYHLALLVHAADQHLHGRFFYTHYTRVLMREDGPRRAVGVRTVPWTMPFDRERFLWTNYIVVHAWMCHREVFAAVGDFRNIRLEDWDFLIRASRAHDFIAIPRFSCEYRFYPSQIGSLLERRRGNIAAVSHIFALHESTDPTIRVQRAEQLAAIEMQIARLADIEMQVAAGGLSGAAAQALIYRAMYDFDVEEADL
jgi:GT2 family glycosyltransferase